MVRRWSYLNSVNAYYSSQYDTHKQTTFSVTVQSTMYFKGHFTVPTLLTRRRWAQRKHVYGWLPLSNLLKSWAQFYRFNRNHAKYVFRQHFSRATFIAFNLVSVKNSIPYLHRGSETVTLSPVSRKLLRYFNRYSNPRTNFLLSLQNLNISSISVDPAVIDILPYVENTYSTVLVQDNISSFSVMPPIPEVNIYSSPSIFLGILTASFNHTLVFIKHIYRLLILSTLVRVIIRDQ